MNIRKLVVFLVAMLASGYPRLPAQIRMPTDHRLGVIAITFDDGSAGHYTNAQPILGKYGLKGVFCVNAGRFAPEPGGGGITAQQCVEMHQAGHEIVDHSLMHDAAIWGPAGTPDEWVRRTEESLAIFRRLDVPVPGWNLPGGPESAYTRPLQEVLSRYYRYSRGGITDYGHPPSDLTWNFRGDPHGFRGVYGSWEGYVDEGFTNKVSRDTAAQALATLKTSRADLLQRGVLVGFCFHKILEENQARWALEEFCRWIAEHRLPVATYAEAFAAFRNPRDYYPEDIEQMPCAGFRYDLDANGRPDGWERCAFAPAGIVAPAGGRVAECGNGATTTLFGPEPGRTRVALLVRSADGTSRPIHLRIQGTELSPAYVPTDQPLAEIRGTVGPGWTELAGEVTVSDRTERCRITLDIPDGAPVYVAEASWRRILGQ